MDESGELVGKKKGVHLHNVLIVLILQLTMQAL